MELTVDTSVIMAVILNEPTKPRLLEVTRGAELVSAPSLPWEVGNALSALFRRRRLDIEQASLALASFREIPVRLPTLEIESSVALAEKHGVYAYDAYVIECARRYQTALLSLDTGQIRVARSEGIDILEVER